MQALLNILPQIKEEAKIHIDSVTQNLRLVIPMTSKNVRLLLSLTSDFQQVEQVQDKYTKTIKAEYVQRAKKLEKARDEMVVELDELTEEEAKRMGVHLNKYPSFTFGKSWYPPENWYEWTRKDGINEEEDMVFVIHLSSPLCKQVQDIVCH
jgi:hypothetical protein